MPLTSLTKLQGTSFGNVTATSITSNTVTVSNTTTSQVYGVSLTAGETLAALDAVYLEPTLTQGTASTASNLSQAGGYAAGLSDGAV